MGAIDQVATDAEVIKLEADLAILKTRLSYAHRAFVIEFAGTPKSGKSTSVEAIRHFFARNGFRVHVLAEKAVACPIPIKGHLFFNTWCASSMLAELLAHVEADADVILVDRGLFDALVWLQLQRKRDEITRHEFDVIENFILLDRWRSMINHVIVMNVDAEVAIGREEHQRISKKSGSIMNRDVLGDFALAVDQACSIYDSKFPQIQRHDTSSGEVRKTNISLARKILSALEVFLDPKILVIKRSALSAISPSDAFTNDVALISSIIEQSKEYVQRSAVEANKEYVQIIPCAMLYHQDKCFTFERDDDDKKMQRYGKLTILEKTHVAESVRAPHPDQFLPQRDELRNALLERIGKSLFIGQASELKLVGYCWNDSDTQHLALVYRMDVQNKMMAKALASKKFRRWRGHSRGGDFKSLASLGSEVSSLESWSRSIIERSGTPILVDETSGA